MRARGVHVGAHGGEEASPYASKPSRTKNKAGACRVILREFDIDPAVKHVQPDFLSLGSRRAFVDEDQRIPNLVQEISSTSLVPRAATTELANASRASYAILCLHGRPLEYFH